jgi:transcriptional regulator with XRE-family HTH domain
MGRGVRDEVDAFDSGAGEARGAALRDAPNPVDVHVGGRIKLRRTLLGLSQERLGDALGLTFQQVQKYERGANRVSASRLHDMARALGVPIGYFFDDLPSEAARATGAVGFAENQEGFGAGIPPDLLARRDSVDLVQAFWRIPDATVRRNLLQLVRSMGGAGEMATE